MGYLTYGFAGAALALVAITIPPFLVLGIAAIYDCIATLKWVGSLMRGVSQAVLGILILVTWIILMHSSLDWRSIVIATTSCALTLTKRVNLLLILALAAAAGYLLYGLG